MVRTSFSWFNTCPFTICRCGWSFPVSPCLSTENAGPDIATRETTIPPAQNLKLAIIAPSYSGDLISKNQGIPTSLFHHSQILQSQILNYSPGCEKNTVIFGIGNCRSEPYVEIRTKHLS